MDWLVATGTLCLGLLIGALVGFYVDESEKSANTVLSHAAIALGGIAAGASLIALIHFLGPNDTSTREYWFYPIGLLLGFAMGMVQDWIWPPNKVISARRKDRQPESL